MSKKFLFVNTDGVPEESPGAYEQTDHVSTSAGAGDAGKPVVLDAEGNIDASMINSGDVDHNQTDNYDIGEHRTINDLASTTTELWSSSKIDGEITRIDAIFSDSNEPTGFVDRTQSTLSFVDGTRTFTITRTGASYDIYSEGTKYTISSDDSVVISTNVGTHFIYYDGNTLSSVFGFDPQLVAGPWVYVASIHWNGSTAVLLGEERHGLTMDGGTHSYLHTTVGTAYASGLDIGGYTFDSDTDADVQVSITSGQVRDEDININIVSTATPSGIFEQDLIDPAKIPVFYKSGASAVWNRDTATSFLFKNTASGRVNFNEDATGWQQTEATDGNFVEYWVLASNDIAEPVISIQGEAQFGTQLAAESDVATRLSTLAGNGLPSQELKPLYHVVIETNDTFGGARKAKIVGISDLRQGAQLPAAAGTTTAAHSDLTGLTDPNAHPASAIVAATGSFGGELSAADDTVQKALDTLDDHLHDDRYFTESEHISSSAGAGDAGKPIILDAGGKLDATFIDQTDVDHDSITNTHNLTTDIDHDQLTNFTQTEHFTMLDEDDLSSDSDTQAATQQSIKNYIDSQIASVQTSDEWQNSVLDVQTDATLDPGASPATGARYILEDIAALNANFGTITKDLDGNTVTLGDDDIVEFNGTEWRVAHQPTTGSFTSDDTDTENLLYFNGTAWVPKGFEQTTASTGLTKVGNDIRVDWSTTFNDAKAIKAEDLNSTTNGEGASIIGIEDTGGIFTSTNVEGALQESQGAIDAIEDNTITSPNATIDVAGTVGGNDQTVDVDFSTAYNDLKAVSAQDFASTASGKGASIVSINDTGSIITATDVEGALQENRTAIDAIEDNTITSGDGSITVAGTVGADNQTVAVTFSTAFNETNRAIAAADINSTTTGEGASIVGIEDSGGNFTATNVEGALNELYSSITANGVTYTVGTGGVAKGEVVYITSNDTVVDYDDLTASHRAIGLAASTESAAATVTVLANDTVLTGVLTGATAGTPIYWDGSALVTSIPSGGGSHVWQSGVAKNATDLHVEVRFVKKNA